MHPDPSLPHPLNEVFAYYIVTELPVGIRGFVVAGVFATIMGSTSAALNSLAVSLTKDWYLPYFNSGATDLKLTSFAKKATVTCAVLLALIAIITASCVQNSPHLTIVPLALGLMGMTYGSLLGIFLLGVLTKNRGNDVVNVIAMTFGILSVLFLGKVNVLGLDFGILMPVGWPTIAWPWYTVIGCITTLVVSLPFSTAPSTYEPS
jgi:Na+/proline symporter